MNIIENRGLETSLDMDWVASLKKRVSDTKFRDRNREPTIYRIPDILKSVDFQAYEPRIVSLGPYHRDKLHLQAMNQLKWKCLKFVLEWQPHVALDVYLGRIKEMEEQARDAYSEKVEMSSNSFVEMMLLDGFFVMLTIMGRYYEMGISEEITLWTGNVVVRDILMLENQLPFFLLETLYESAFSTYVSFRKLTLEFIRIHFSTNLKLPSDNDKETFHHIIHLFLSCIYPTTNHGNDNGNGNGDQSSTFGFLFNSKPVKTEFVSLPSKLRSCFLSQVNKKRTVRDANSEKDLPVSGIPRIPSATVCKEAGIHFKRKQKAQSFLDITFHNGKLEIPQLRIEDHINSLLRNLIAYEQCSTDFKFHVTSYMMLMNYIIDTAADVELLQQQEIIIGDLGDNQEVATLFNKLSTNVTYTSCDFYLADVVTAMRKHRDGRCNKWRARLNRDYFSNPWAVISLIGALVLFLLTALQSTFAVLSYFRPPK